MFEVKDHSNGGVMENRLQRMVDRIRMSPGIFLGQYSIFRLRSFLDGYVFALEEIDGAESERALLETIRSHIEREHYFDVSRSWDIILWFISANEQEALDFFWTIWDDIKRSEN